MYLATSRWMLMALLGPCVLLLLDFQAGRSQVPETPPARGQEQLKQQDELVQQVEQLRSQGKYQDALAPAARALSLSRALRGEEHAEVALALARLAELHELAGDLGPAGKYRQQGLALQTKLDGEKHWRTADARLALAFAQKVAALSEADRAKVIGALQKEQEAIRLDRQGKYAEAERVAQGVLEVYRAALGPATVEVARVWHLVGRARLGQSDSKGGKEANEQAVTIRRKVLSQNHPDVGRSLNNLGLALQALKDLKGARKCLEEAATICRESLGPDDQLTAMAVNNLGGVQYALREYAATRKSFAEVLAIRRKILPKDHPDIAKSLHNLGIVQRNQREYEPAKKSHEEALAIRRKALPKDHPDIAKSLTNLGVVQKDLRDYEGARKSHEEALAIRRKTFPKDHPDIANSLTNLGRVQRDLREYEGACKSHEEALAIFRQALPKDHPDIAMSLNNLGNVQGDLREYEGARQSHEEALAILRKALPKDHPNLAISLNDLGAVQRDLREYEGARKSHEEALAIRRKAFPKDHPDIAQSLYNLGNVLYNLRDYAAARKSHEEALALFRQALPKDHPTIADSLNSLGVVQCDLRDDPAARQSLEEALAIRRKALPKDHPDIADSLNNLGCVQRDLQDYAAAMKSHEEALAIRRKALSKDHPDIALSLSNLGNVLSDLRDYATAMQSYEQALTIRRKVLPKDHPDIALSLDHLGITRFWLRDYAAARQNQEEALAICRKALPKDHHDIARSLAGLGVMDLLSEIHVRQAGPRLTEATDLVQAHQLRLAFAQVEQDQLATAALAHMLLSVLLTVTLTTQEDPDSAYDRVLRVKGSVTAQQLWARQARDAADPDTARLLTRLREVTRQLVGLSVAGRPTDPSAGSRDVAALVRSLSTERADLERQLSERSQVFRAFQARARAGSSEVRAALPGDVALVDLIEYTHVAAPAEGQREHTEEQRVLAFVVRRGQKRVDAVPLGSSKALAELIDRWRASYGAGKAPPGVTADPGAELRKRLWEPLEKHLGGVKVVLVSPDGPLHGLPWAALPGATKSTFLIHDHAFATVPVPQLLPDLLRGGTGRPADPASLVIGNIDFDALPDSAAEVKPEIRFLPLPGTKAEAAAVHDLFRKAFADRPAELLTGKGATKEEFVSRAPKCSHLLVATHGFFLPNPERKESSGQGRPSALEALLFRRDLATINPALRSGLAFAGANRTAVGRGNAFLTAFEAAELELSRVDLAVLSACETGLGKVEDGEGVLGLQRAFQVAGARTTVTSLWNVPDAATQTLMTRFHRNLWEQKGATPLGKLAALREAQLWLIQEGPKHPELLRGGLKRPDLKPEEGDAVSPFYWAAFVLSGDWR